MSDPSKSLVERIAVQPELRGRIDAIPAIAASKDRRLGSTDEAE